MQDAWRRIVRVDHFPLAGGSHFCAISRQFVPGEFRFGAQVWSSAFRLPARVGPLRAALLLCRLEPELHASRSQ